MKDWFSDIIAVLNYSRRTQWAIILGMVGFVVIDLFGKYQLSNFQLSGIIQPLTEAVKANAYERYEKAAFGCLFSFWALAFTMYKKDKKRLWNIS